DGIRDFHVTGVQTCALPIWTAVRGGADAAPLEYAASARASASSIASTSRRCSTSARLRYRRSATAAIIGVMGEFLRNGKLLTLRSEERRVGKECRSRRSL